MADKPDPPGHVALGMEPNKPKKGNKSGKHFINITHSLLFAVAGFAVGGLVGSRCTDSSGRLRRYTEQLEACRSYQGIVSDTLEKYFGSGIRVRNPDGTVNPETTFSYLDKLVQDGAGYKKCREQLASAHQADTMEGRSLDDCLNNLSKLRERSRLLRSSEDNARSLGENFVCRANLEICEDDLSRVRGELAECQGGLMAAPVCEDTSGLERERDGYKTELVTRTGELAAAQNRLEQCRQSKAPAVAPPPVCDTSALEKSLAALELERDRCRVGFEARTKVLDARSRELDEAQGKLDACMKSKASAVAPARDCTLAERAADDKGYKRGYGAGRRDGEKTCGPREQAASSLGYNRGYAAGESAGEKSCIPREQRRKYCAALKNAAIKEALAQVLTDYVRRTEKPIQVFVYDGSGEKETARGVIAQFCGADELNTKNTKLVDTVDRLLVGLYGVGEIHPTKWKKGERICSTIEGTRVTIGTEYLPH